MSDADKVRVFIHEREEYRDVAFVDTTKGDHHRRVPVINPGEQLEHTAIGYLIVRKRSK